MKLICCVIAEEPTVFLTTPKVIAGFISFHNFTVFPAISMQSTPSHRIAFKIRFNHIISSMSVSSRLSIHFAFFVKKNDMYVSNCHILATCVSRNNICKDIASIISEQQSTL